MTTPIMRKIACICAALCLLASVSFKSGGAYCPCLPPWETFGEHCYLVVTEELNFPDAEDNCLSYSRGLRRCHLASIANAKEYDFIVGVTVAATAEPMHVWVGLSDRLETGNFVWTDGSSSSYRRWTPGDPENANKCVRISANHDYNMTDKQCASSKFASVCKVRQRQV